MSKVGRKRIRSPYTFRNLVSFHSLVSEPLSEDHALRGRVELDRFVMG